MIGKTIKYLKTQLKNTKIATSTIYFKYCIVEGEGDCLYSMDGTME